MSDIDQALQNLEDIKSDDEPEKDESAAVTTQHETESIATPNGDALTLAENEVDRLYSENGLEEYLPKWKLHVGIARWESRNGYCRYNYKLNSKRHGKRLSGDGESRDGHHAIVINEVILEHDNEDGFYDTVRHEVAHAIAYEKYGESQEHNRKWKRIAKRLGADPSSCHSKHETKGDYLYGCPNGCFTNDKKRRSKRIKKPWQGRRETHRRFCKTCEATPVAWDRGKERPEEPGTVDVEGIPWSNKDEYLTHPTQEIN